MSITVSRCAYQSGVNILRIEGVKAFPLTHVSVTPIYK